MKRFLAHIITVLFLLFFAGTKLFVPTAFANTSSNSSEQVITAFTQIQQHTNYKATKNFSKDFSFASIETDTSDLQSQDTLILIATLVKVIFCAICVHFVLYAIKRRRVFYEAFVLLFQFKYIVFRTLRI